MRLSYGVTINAPPLFVATHTTVTRKPFLHSSVCSSFASYTLINNNTNKIFHCNCLISSQRSTSTSTSTSTNVVAPPPPLPPPQPQPRPSVPVNSGVIVDDDVDNFIVANFYHFVLIEHPQQEVAKHLDFLKGLDIHGRIYLSEQGINAQYSGPSEDAVAYVEWLKEDLRFADILVQMSPALNGHAFPRLKLRYKSSLVQMEGGILHLPLLDPSMRATPLSPLEWRERLKAIHEIDKTSKANCDSKSVVLLDVRNGYEWDIGHFHGAERPNVDCFRKTSFGLSQEEIIDSDVLANVDKDRTDILMYCTGGIRCDVYSTVLRQQGFQNLYTLEGGVSHYLKSVGSQKWVGNLFVFDDRLALPPTAYVPESRDAISKNPLQLEQNSFSRCHVCGSTVREQRHRNCANLDCNLLFLCCPNCVENLRGCCCQKCSTAPRLRPVLSGNQRYKKWHTYRDQQL